MGSSLTWVQVLSVTVSVLLPILVALVTARVADGAVKALVLLLLAAVTGLLTAWLDAYHAGQAFDLLQAGFDTLVAFVIATAAHFGLWKPTSVTGSAGVVQVAVPGGVGGRHRA